MSWAERPLDDAAWVFVDVETTGLKVDDGHRVCELAVVKGSLAEVMDEYDVLIDPERPIDAEASAVSGISDADIADQPTFAALAEKAHALLSGAVIVAHNAPFDVGFLETEFSRCGLSLPAAPIVDTTVIATEVLGLRSRALGSVARALELADKPTHRALDDARATRGVLLAGLDRLTKQGVETVGQLIDTLMPSRPPDASLLDDPLIALHEALRNGQDVAIAYEGSRGAQERVVRPIRLERRGRLTYLDAYCRLRKGPRQFRVDRIVSARVVEQ